MPYSYDFFKKEIKKHFLKHVPKTTKILDVGPGSGTYSKLLKPLGYHLDCVEIWEPYIEEFQLQNLYTKVIVKNILDFDFSGYDYLIFGDILEHLSTDDATKILNKIQDKNIKCLVAVPFLYEQDSFEGNKYEIHLQPDLTPEVVVLRYKNLTLLYGNSLYGYYTNYYKWSEIELLKQRVSNFFLTLLKFNKNVYIPIF